MNMVIIFMGFVWKVLICVFQIEGCPSPQVSCDLQQLGKLLLRVELKHFSFPSAQSLQKLGLLVSEQPYQVNGKDCLLACARILIFGIPLEDRNPLRWRLMAGFCHGVPGLERPLGNSA